MNERTFPMMKHKITPSVDYKLWLKCMDTLLNEPSHQNSVDVPKVVKPTNKKTLFSYG